MSIATNIDGSSSNQLLDILSTLVTSPGVFESKIKELQDATDEHKKFVALVGPASEVLLLREEALKAKEEAEKLVQDAKEEASAIKAKAKDQANNTLAKAKAEADEITAKASDKLASANKASEEASVKTVEVNKAKTVVEALRADLQAKLNAAAEAEAEAEKVKKAYSELRSELISKHRAFIESL